MIDRYLLVYLIMWILWVTPAQAELAVDIDALQRVLQIDDQLQSQMDINDIPGDASLVASSQWNGQRDTTIKDMTDYTPGVFAQPRDGAESLRLSVRGSGLANTFQGRGLLVMQDGIPINMADGEFEFPVIDPWLVRYAEILPGANALVDGGSNFGGAINLISPNGVTDNGETIRLESGSFGTLHGQASTGQKWEGGDIYAAATDFIQDGFRQQNQQETTRFNGNLGWQINDHATSRFYISHTAADAEIPGAITMAQLDRNPHAANPANSANNYQRNLDITRLDNKTVWEKGPDQVESILFYTYRTLDNPVTTYEFQHNNDIGIREKYHHRDGRDKWLFGFNSYYGAADEARYVNDDATPGAPILTRNLYAATSEAYGQYEKYLNARLAAIIGTQISYVTRNIDQKTPTTTTQNRDYVGTSPRVGLRYDINSTTQGFANLSRSFEPPTFSELSGGNTPGFRDLDAQQATTAEIGTRGTQRGWHWQAAYYHGWLRDELVNYRFADGSTATTNVLRSKRDGVELGTNGDLINNILLNSDALSLRAAYTFSHFSLDHDPIFGDNSLPGVPEHYLRAEMLYRHPSGMSVGPNIEWSPAHAPVDLANSVYADPYALLGLRGTWDKPDGRMSIYVEGKNLFDRKYAATYNVIPDAGGQDGRYFFPGEGRAVYAGLRWGFE